MSLGFVLLIVLIIILIGGVGPGFYTGSPWPYGYGAGHYGIGIVGVILIVVLFLAVTGGFDEIHTRKDFKPTGIPPSGRRNSRAGWRVTSGLRRRAARWVRHRPRTLRSRAARDCR